MNDKQFQVLLADDSAVVRGLLSRWLDQEINIHVAAYAATGKQVLNELEYHDIDVIILDTEMPEMDGFQALPAILRSRPDVRVIMAYTLSHDVETCTKTLQNGAADYIVKPASSRELQTNQAFRREIIEKIKALASARRHQQRLTPGTAGMPHLKKVKKTAFQHPAKTATRVSSKSTDYSTSREHINSTQTIILRAASRSRPEILAIGSSTGGPQALFTLFSALQGQISNVPVVITQHMPADFTSILTDNLSRVCEGICKEGENGEALIAGNIYLAPGGHHMLLDKRGSQVVIRITRDQPENFCRPAVDPMMRSLKTVYHDRVLAVILTGMGHDGLKGCRQLADAGSTILAQDEASSIVWGMPGAVAMNELCTAVLTLDKLAPAIAKLLRGQN